MLLDATQINELMTLSTERIDRLVGSRVKITSSSFRKLNSENGNFIYVCTQVAIGPGMPADEEATLLFVTMGSDGKPVAKYR